MVRKGLTKLNFQLSFDFGGTLFCQKSYRGGTEYTNATDQEVVGAGGEDELVSSEGPVGAAEAHVAQALRLKTKMICFHL